MHARAAFATKALELTRLPEAAECREDGEVVSTWPCASSSLVLQSAVLVHGCSQSFSRVVHWINAMYIKTCKEGLAASSFQQRKLRVETKGCILQLPGLAQGGIHNGGAYVLLFAGR